MLLLNVNVCTLLFARRQRVHLDIQIGEHANDYQQIMQRDKLSELQLRVRQLLDQVEQITKEQNYQRVSYCCVSPTAMTPRHTHAHHAQARGCGC